MEPVEVVKGFYWVGVVDWNVRDFHGYTTYRGTTYNAFLLIDDKIVLFDTVRYPFRDQLLQNIRNIVDPAEIDYIVVNHVEPDHSSSLPGIVETVKPEKLLCSPMGKKALLDHYHREDWPYEVVESGRPMVLGRRTVEFLETRMLHWPDSMFSYLKEERLLISSDAFGEHWATSERFDDQVDQGELFRHAAKYYANILLPYSPLVGKLLSKVQEMGLAIDMIAPDHGVIWRSNPLKIVEAYDRWSSHKAEQKAVIIYDTMWKSTEAMAFAVAAGLVEEEVSVRLMDLKCNHRSDIVAEVLDAKALVFGSSTLNNGMMPEMAAMLHYLRGLRPQNKIGAAIGSYGWSGEAVKLMNQAMEEMKIHVIDPGITVRYVPKAEDLKSCTELGRRLGKAIHGA
ncbi:MAG: flavodoxin domain-containing protein [Deltaproteobacteria bacterium]|nr:flavodoxin domain-containing protein [Deltaproteobacteria bacterium]MBW2121920.1 flavodoxin domain-containing protein [Deltaproteobacteria bacterium]